MLKVFSIVAALLAARRAARLALNRDDGGNWRRDPLSHPALRAMSQVELADLPIGHPILPRDTAAC